MTNMIIQSKRIYLNQEFKKAQLEIKDSKIVSIHEYNELPVDIDYEDNRILPGFYDIHTHGYFGYDTTSTDRNGLINWLKYLPSEGVCGVFPTTLTQSKDVLINALNTISEVKESAPSGSKILGIHLEGPYINPNRKGAHPLEYIRNTNLDEFKDLEEASNNLIRIVTLAPELDKDYSFTKYCTNKHINVSIGHSDADYETCVNSINNGSRGFTHTYNGMSKDKDIGVLKASLTSSSYSEIIGDLIHVPIVDVKDFYNKKSNKAIMITDSLMAKGYETGTVLNFNGQDIKIYPDGSAHLLSNEKLAGSTLKMNEGLRNLIEKAKVDYRLAIDSITINPMKYLDIKNKGILEIGYDADIVILDDNYQVINTFVEGILCE